MINSLSGNFVLWMLVTNCIFYCRFMLVTKLFILMVIIGRVRCFGILFLAKLCVVGFWMLHNVDACYATLCHAQYPHWPCYV